MHCCPYSNFLLITAVDRLLKANFTALRTLLCWVFNVQTGKSMNSSKFDFMAAIMKCEIRMIKVAVKIEPFYSTQSA